jgi:hypothetical protein
MLNIFSKNYAINGNSLGDRIIKGAAAIIRKNFLHVKVLNKQRIYFYPHGFDMVFLKLFMQGLLLFKTG